MPHKLTEVLLEVPMVDSADLQSLLRAGSCTYLGFQTIVEMLMATNTLSRLFNLLHISSTLSMSMEVNGSDKFKWPQNRKYF